MSDKIAGSEYVANVETYLKEELLWEGILDMSPDGLMVCDWSGSICLVNMRAELMFGYSRSELLGQKIEVLLPEDVREVHGTKHREKFRRQPGTREMGLDLKLRGRHKEGDEFPIKVMLAPFTTEIGPFVAAWIRTIN